MENATQKSNIKILASLSVFRELYNQEKDIYSVLTNFIESCILSHQKYSFSLPDIRGLLKTEFDFDIPDAVIKTALKRFSFAVEYGIYTVPSSFHAKQETLNQQNNGILNQHAQILHRLFEFIADGKGDILLDEDKENITQSFIDFLLDEKVKNGFTDHISAFVIKNEEDGMFLKLLNIAREGVVLYTGIQYSPSFNQPLKMPLKIYLNTEILFHCAGYNGELFKKLFDDFYSLSKEINTKKELVSLRFFTEIKNEVDNFFKVAEYIVQGKAQLKHSMTAMRAIVNGCKDGSDVLEKKIKFYALLEECNIKEEGYKPDYSDDEHKFNIYNQEIVDYFLKSIDGIEEHEIENVLKLLNYISYKRGENSNNNFDNIGHMMLSENTKVLNIAFDEKIRTNGNVPLASNLSFLTNRFWMKLSKGFGGSNTPKSFNVITKAQIALSSHVNAKMNDRYKETQSKFKNGELNEEQAKNLLADFRHNVKLPEEIDCHNVGLTLSAIISENSIDEHLYKHEHLKNTLNEKIAESGELKASLENIKKEKHAYSKENIELKNELLQSKIKEKINLEKEEGVIAKKANSKFQKHKIIIITIYSIPWMVLVYLVYRLGWDIMEQWTWIIGIVLLAIPFFYSLATEKTFSLLDYLKNKKQEFLLQEYNSSGFDVLHIKNLASEIKKLEEEVVTGKK